MSDRVHVMHMTDTLRPGGTERVAVNVVNLLPRYRYATYLCTTREDGPLAALVASDVRRLRLQRTHRFDSRALRALIAYVRAERIQIIHAHGSAIFVAVVAASAAPHPAVVWHDHFGRCEIEGRPAWLYRLAVRRTRAVIAVNERLADWSRHALGMRADRVWYVPNFVCAPDAGATGHPDPARALDLPGTPGTRLACVANFRPQKDHLTLIAAMSAIVRRVPSAHLLLVGDAGDGAYRRQIQDAIAREGLQRHVTILGVRDDVPAILQTCDVGVLSSRSEGLPLALLEYGLAGLAVVATDVGQCGDVLGRGDAGLLVPPGAPDVLADRATALLEAADRRAALGARLQRRIRECYSPSAVLTQIGHIYDVALNQAPHRRWDRVA